MAVTGKPFLGRRGTNLASWCLLLVTLGALAVAVVLPVHRLTVPDGSVPVTLADDSGQSFSLGGLPEGVTVGPSDAAATLTVSSLPVGLRLLTVTPTVLAALAVAVGAWWLAALLRSVATGRPFDARNPRRLAGVAAAVLVGGVVAPILGNAVAVAVLAHLDLTGPESPVALVLLELNFLPILLSVVLLAAAEAFRRGASLTHEVDGLV